VSRLVVHAQHSSCVAFQFMATVHMRRNEHDTSIAHTSCRSVVCSRAVTLAPSQRALLEARAFATQRNTLAAQASRKMRSSRACIAERILMLQSSRWAQKIRCEMCAYGHQKSQGAVHEDTDSNL
jgi:hypothetical protein